MPTKEIVREPIAFTAFNFCTGEDVSYSGDFFLTFTHVDRPNSNGFHEKLFINYKVTGVGLTSGAEYDLHEVQHGSLNDNGPLPFKDTFRIFVLARTDGPDNDLVITYRFHITINANGEVTVVFEEPLTGTCK